jgi:hypothetical protein
MHHNFFWNKKLDKLTFFVDCVSKVGKIYYSLVVFLSIQKKTNYYSYNWLIYIKIWNSMTNLIRYIFN